MRHHGNESCKAAGIANSERAMKTTIWAFAAATCLTACTTTQTASTGSSQPLRAGSGVVETVRVSGVAASGSEWTRQGAPVGASVYGMSTYSQPAYSYPASSPGFASDAPREPAPGGVSARSDTYEVVVRMED